jgi:hypothetical protein
VISMEYIKQIGQIAEKVMRNQIGKRFEEATNSGYPLHLTGAFCLLDMMNFEGAYAVNGAAIRKELKQAVTNLSEKYPDGGIPEEGKEMIRGKVKLILNHIEENRNPDAVLEMIALETHCRTSPEESDLLGILYRERPTWPKNTIPGKE